MPQLIFPLFPLKYKLVCDSLRQGNERVGRLRGSSGAVDRGLFEDIIDIVLSLAEEGEVELETIIIVQRLPFQLARTDRVEELRAIDRDCLLLPVALRLV